jgi:hypothetical protein
METPLVQYYIQGPTGLKSLGPAQTSVIDLSSGRVIYVGGKRINEAELALLDKEEYVFISKDQERFPLERDEKIVCKVSELENLLSRGKAA